MTDAPGGGGSPELSDRLRRKLQGSAREEIELEARLRNLELERRSASAILEREEREMRANLERLQAEKTSNEGSPSSLDRLRTDAGKMLGEMTSLLLSIFAYANLLHIMRLL
jgi:hypothetical protein